MLITCEELKRALDKEDTLIIDARDWHSYINGHIPSAINLDLFAFHFYITSEKGIEIFNEMMVNLLSSIGISYNKFVIFYDDISGILAARGIWLMHYFSHFNTAILDGGIEEWKKYYELEFKVNTPKPSNFKPKINNEVLARLDDIINTNHTIIDSRSKEEYEGKIVRSARGGHIPKAINIEWSLNLNGNKFKDREDLLKLYKDYNDVICYCQGGYRAAHTYLALKILGRNAKVYLGSWYEYGNRLDLPIE